MLLTQLKHVEYRGCLVLVQVSVHCLSYWIHVDYNQVNFPINQTYGDLTQIHRNKNSAELYPRPLAHNIWPQGLMNVLSDGLMTTTASKAQTYWSHVNNSEIPTTPATVSG